MALQYAASSRLVTYDKNICPQCSAWLLAPDWSEHFNERCVRHSWSCDACGHGFETTVVFPETENRGLAEPAENTQSFQKNQVFGGYGCRLPA